MSLPQLEINPLDRPIKGAGPFSGVLGWPEKQVRYALERGLLDADKLGTVWVSTPRRLLAQFAGARSDGPAAA